MLNKYEAKTEEEAIIKAMEDLNCEKNNLLYKTEIKEGKLFKSSKANIIVVQKSDVKKYISEYFKELGNLMNIQIEAEVLYNNDSFNVTLVTNNNALLIGKDGKNLSAIQTIIRQNIKLKTEMPIKVNLDISDYKLKKLKTLEKEIRKIAKEVLKSKVDVSLDPMNSYERRFIHTIIGEYENLETESIGEGKERHVTIKYIEK